MFFKFLFSVNSILIIYIYISIVFTIDSFRYAHAYRA